MSVKVIVNDQNVAVTSSPHRASITKSKTQSVNVSRGPRGLQGEQGEQGEIGPSGPPGSSVQYTHEQTVASSVWEINHDLDKKPSVTIVDSADSVVIGDVFYVSNGNIIVEFDAPFTGKAYLN
jgi:hypothetical protein